MCIRQLAVVTLFLQRMASPRVQQPAEHGATVEMRQAAPIDRSAAAHERRSMGVPDGRVVREGSVGLVTFHAARKGLSVDAGLSSDQARGGSSPMISLDAPA